MFRATTYYIILLNFCFIKTLATDMPSSKATILYPFWHGTTASRSRKEVEAYEQAKGQG